MVSFLILTAIFYLGIGLLCGTIMFATCCVSEEVKSKFSIYEMYIYSALMIFAWLPVLISICFDEDNNND